MMMTTMMLCSDRIGDNTQVHSCAARSKNRVRQVTALRADCVSALTKMHLGKLFVTYTTETLSAGNRSSFFDFQSVR